MSVIHGLERQPKCFCRYHGCQSHRAGCRRLYLGELFGIAIIQDFQDWRPAEFLLLKFRGVDHSQGWEHLQTASIVFSDTGNYCVILSCSHGFTQLLVESSRDSIDCPKRIGEFGHFDGLDLIEPVPSQEFSPEGTL